MQLPVNSAGANRQDVDFLIRHDHITARQMEPAFASVRMPDIQELRDAFDRALPAVRKLLASAACPSAQPS